MSRSINGRTSGSGSKADSPHATRSASAQRCVRSARNAGRAVGRSEAWKARAAASNSGHRPAGPVSPATRREADHPSTTHRPSRAHTGRASRKPADSSNRVRSSATQLASSPSSVGLRTTEPTRTLRPSHPARGPRPRSSRMHRARSGGSTLQACPHRSCPALCRPSAAAQRSLTGQGLWRTPRRDSLHRRRLTRVDVPPCVRDRPVHRARRGLRRLVTR